MTKREKQDQPQQTALSSHDAEGFGIVFPSGRRIDLVKTEILLVRDLCNDHMARFGAVDSLGREIQNWDRPHHESMEALDKVRADTAPPDAGG
jgi:hypothetical protein